MRGGNEMTTKTTSCLAGIGNMWPWAFFPWLASLINPNTFQFSLNSDVVKSLFNTRLQAGRKKCVRVGALIENYSPILELGLEYHETKFVIIPQAIGSCQWLLRGKMDVWRTFHLAAKWRGWRSKRLERGRQMGQNIYLMTLMASNQERRKGS